MRWYNNDDRCRLRVQKAIFEGDIDTYPRILASPTRMDNIHNVVIA